MRQLMSLLEIFVFHVPNFGAIAGSFILQCSFSAQWLQKPIVGLVNYCHFHALLPYIQSLDTQSRSSNTQSLPKRKSLSLHEIRDQHEAHATSVFSKPDGTNGRTAAKFPGIIKRRECHRRSQISFLFTFFCPAKQRFGFTSPNFNCGSKDFKRCEVQIIGSGVIRSGLSKSKQPNLFRATN
jgi:hypothetical protein